MTTTPRTVFVLGAGFARAFVPRAPLLVDHWQISKLRRQFRPFTYASQLLEFEFNRPPAGLVDIERLMTRLQDGMPYDRYEGSEYELPALASELRKVFHSRIAQTVGRAGRKPLLARFAARVVADAMNIVTFNYDDLLDKHLWWAGSHAMIPDPPVPYWHPDGGYGFFCRPATLTVEERTIAMDQTAMHVLKLHGSFNWRVRRGTPLPAALDSVMHYEDWLPHVPEEGHPTPAAVDIERHLDPQPLWIPPVLSKSVSEQPVLSLVWHTASEVLHAAEKVVFIGYSFPATDIASRTLFEETVEDVPPDAFTIVTRVERTDRERFVSSYRQSLGAIPDANFHFDGAIDWLRRFLDRT